MTLFPLDAVRNAAIDQDLELLLEDIREELAVFPFTPEIGGSEAVLEAYDQARPRLNVLAAALGDRAEASGVDVSTGLGFLPVLLARRGHRVVATEMEPATSAFAVAHGIEVRPYRLGVDRAPVAAASVEFVVFAEVLEHLKLAPVTVLRELGGWLKPGGRLVLTTPNIARLEHVELLAAGENFLEPFPGDLPLSADATDYLEHVREYSVREVVEAIEAAGLGVERVMMTGWGEGGYRPLANPFANGITVVVAER